MSYTVRINGQWEDADDAIESVIGYLESCRDEVRDAISDAENRESQIDELEDKISDLEGTIRNLEDQLNEFEEQEDYSSLLENYKQLECINKELVSELEDMNSRFPF